jgi:cytochrome P450
VPCGSPLESVCPPCAQRCKSLRIQQCREGWHLEDEPVAQPGPLDDWQAWLLDKRAEFQLLRDQAAATGQDPGELDELLAELDRDLAATGIRGKPDPGRKDRARRRRSTRRRQDTPACPAARSPRAPPAGSTPPPTAKTYRPSMFLTLTCDSYGKVGDDGTPLDPALIPRAIEEILRWDAPVPHATFRYTTQDVAFGGTVIPAFTQVIISLGAANRDPARYANPAALDIARADTSHLAFGHGIHHCLGARLARLEGMIALTTLHGRFPAMRLAVPRPALRWAHGDGLVLRGLTELPVILRP